MPSDTEMLNWLETNGLPGATIWRGVAGRWLVVGQQVTYQSLRESIANAMNNRSADPKATQ